MTVNADRQGVLLVRVWLEDGTDQFRARLTTPDLGGEVEVGADLSVAVTSSPDGVSQAVHSWLGEFLRATGRD